jgi:hypothetical protein
VRGNVRSRDPRSLVGGIIQHLDLQPLSGIVELGYGVNQSFQDVELIVDRQLHRNDRPFLGFRNLRWIVSAAAQV